MSLVNQVLKELQSRQGEAPDASGLTPASPVVRPRTGQRWGVIAAAAILVGIGLVFAEQALRDDAPVEPVLAVAVQADAPDPAPTTVAAEPAADEIVPIEPVEAVATEAPAVPDEVVEEVVLAAVEPAPAPAVEPAPAPPVEPAEPATRTPPVRAAPSDGDLRRTLVAETPQQRAGDAYTAGVRALSEGRRGEAETRFRSALSHDASHHEARLALANLLAADGRIRESEAQLQEGLRIAPRYADYAERYARMLFERGDLAGAIGVLNAAAPPVVASPDYHALRAALLQRAGHHDDAADAYGALVDVRPDNGLWWMGLAISLEGAGRTAAAHDAYARAARDPRLSTDVARFVHERLAVLDHGTGQ